MEPQDLKQFPLKFDRFAYIMERNQTFSLFLVIQASRLTGGKAAGPLRICLVERGERWMEMKGEGNP